ncbi:hypothetical protein LTR95_011478 [Oleoguttula sp. CCFEE 5521]
MDRRARPRTTPQTPMWLLQQYLDQKSPTYHQDLPNSSPPAGPGSMDPRFGFRSYHYAVTQDTLSTWPDDYEQTAAHTAQHANSSRLASEALLDTNDITSQGNESMNNIVKMDDSTELVAAIEDTTQNKGDGGTDKARGCDEPATKDVSPLQNAVDTPPDTETIYIGNLTSAATDEEVEQMFSEHNFLEVKRPSDYGAQELVCCAFLVFGKIRDARRCVREMHNKQMRDQTLHVAFAERILSALVPPPHERTLDGPDESVLGNKGPRKPRVVEAAADPVWVGPPRDLS